MSKTFEAEEDGWPAWGEDFCDDKFEDLVGDVGIGGTEGGETGEGDVGLDGDGNIGLGGWLGDFQVGEVRVRGGDLTEEAGEIGGLDVRGWGG